jgi:hypothetical protein
MKEHAGRPTRVAARRLTDAIVAIAHQDRVVLGQGFGSTNLNSGNLCHHAIASASPRIQKASLPAA